MPEVVRDSDQNLNAVLQCLNGFLLTLSYDLSDEKKDLTEKKLKAIFLAIKKSHEKKDMTVFLEILKDKHFNAYYISDHKKLFNVLRERENTYITPWIGDIDKPNSPLHCKDLIVGLKFQYKNFTVLYRVDYDQKKGLHINIDFIDGDDIFNFAIAKIKPPVRYYDVKPSDKSLEVVKFKFFIKMAYSYKNPFSDQDDNQFLKQLDLALNGCDRESFLHEKSVRDSVVPKMIYGYTKNRSEKIDKIPVNIWENKSEDSEAESETSLASSDNKDKKSVKQIANVGFHAKKSGDGSNAKKESKQVLKKS